jgi:PAS domain S-box-containing protein
VKSFGPNQLNSEEQFKDLFDSAHDLVHFAQPDGTLFYVNRSWMNLLEYTEQEILGRTIFSFVEEGDLHSFLHYRKQVLADGADKNQIITTLKTKSGRLVKLEGFITVKISNGQPVHTRGIFRDVTDKLESEAKLKEREHNMHQLLVHAPDAIIVIDREGKISFWNPKAEAIFGWSFEEVAGNTLTQTIIPLQYRSAHEQGMQRYLSTGEVRVLNKTIEITALNKAGEEFYVSLTISTTMQNGEVAFIAFIRDINTQKKNELELAKRTEQLEISNKELEHFAHLASHDMKEPVRKVRLFSEMITTEFSSILPEQARLYLTKVQESAGRLKNMVEGILTHSLISNNAEPFEIIDLGAILQTIITDLELLIQEKNAAIKYQHLPSFEGVPFLIYQLFYNLIMNSLKFSKKNTSPVIIISGRLVKGNEVGKEAAKHLFACIEISDNGIGFSTEHTDKMFKKFTRLNAKQQYEGTGLGLALCKNIAEKHGGFISATGEEGLGANFSVVLPQQRQS